MSDETSLTLCIRLGTSIRFTVPSASTDTVTSSSTILQIKNLIAKEDASDKCPSARQRLIYKGRILSDDSRTLSDYGVTGDNQTLHLVKGSAPSVAPSNTGAPPPLAAPTPFTASSNPTHTPGGSSTPAAPNPLMSMMQGMQGMEGMQGMQGGMPDMASMQQQLMQNPEMVSNLMNSPMMQSMLSNPDFMRTMMESNPEMRRVMDSNPQLRHVLDDPELMRRSLQMMRDPSAMQNAMRNQDLAMSQIENLPGGFNALRRMYEDVQEPMMDAMSGSQANDTTTPSNTPSSNPGGAMPNPWGSGGSPAPAAATSPSPSNPPNPWGSAPLPNMNPNLNMNPNPNMNPNAAMNPNPNMNLDQTIQMLENPMIHQMMDQMLADPSTLQTMMESNPMLQQLRQSNPTAAAMMSNPDTMRAMMDPNNLRAMSQMQQSMQTMNQGGMPAFPQFPPPGAIGGVPTAGTGNGTPANNPGLDFSTLLGQFQATSLDAPNNDPPEVRWRHQLDSLRDMGFSDSAANVAALSAVGGNVNRAVERLLGGDSLDGGL